MPEGTDFKTPDSFLTVRQVERELGVSYHTALSYIKRRQLKAVEMGGRYKVSRTELERFKEHGNHPDAEGEENVEARV